MKKTLLSFFILQSMCFISISQTPNQIINTVNQRFNKVQNYKADVLITCKIPSINVNTIKANVIYKKPDRFKIKSTGILILPKQTANFLFTSIADTTAFTAVKTGEEIIGGVKTSIINVIPNQDTSDLILGKFWIDAARGLVLKSQLTTKSQGTILIENIFGSMIQYALPDKMLFTIETQKFKLPKALTLDINRSAPTNTVDDGKGRITLLLSNYVVNKGVSDEEFK
ncbi:MAG: hypothetical protein LH473_05380 [Chitinophagales bacterium]|nr:hypothetical protein [Chitinophagales bacterium]